jgi:hypothetical protein
MHALSDSAWSIRSGVAACRGSPRVNAESEELSGEMNPLGPPDEAPLAHSG